MTTFKNCDYIIYNQIIEKPKTKSAVWLHFGLPADENGCAVNINVAICKLCSKPVSVKGGSTSSLSCHLRHHHPEEFKDLPSSS